jgi:hypothetical protein
MSNSIDWGEFGGSADGQYPEKFRFNEPGDSLAGIVRDVRIATMPDGSRLPNLEIEDANGTTWSVLAGPVGLQRALSAQRPATGDKISVLFTSFGEPKPGKSAPKLFDVQVKRGDETPAPAPAPAAAAPSASSLI